MPRGKYPRKKRVSKRLYKKGRSGISLARENKALRSIVLRLLLKNSKGE